MAIKVEVNTIGGYTLHSTHDCWNDAVDQADMVHGRIVVDDLNSLEFVGWSDGSSELGVSYHEFFDRDGVYLGPDVNGVEPEFEYGEMQ